MSFLKINNQVISFTPPMALSTLMEQAGLTAVHPCGGRGVCGNCAVTIEGELSPLTPAEIKAGTRLSCQTVVLGDATLKTEQSGALRIEGAGEQTAVGGQKTLVAAVDIGTTTVVAQVYDETGALCGGAAALNPQTATSSDVMGRINTALTPAGLKKLQEQITLTLRQLLLKAAGDLSRIQQMVITGNTAMLYLFTGRDPHCLATAPFAADHLFDEQTELFGIPTYLPPCISAFVGADITCALLESDLCRHTSPALLCDIGTNGEIALWTGSELFVTSTAAGPAFEGAGIRQGMLAESGAIDRVWEEQGNLRISVIGDALPKGICGSGLIDAVATGLVIGAIDETGYLEEDPLPLCDTVALHGQDVRNVQLAKAAIAAGIYALLHAAGLEETKIDQCIIAGGFGKHLRPESVYTIGLLPKSWEQSLRPIGNAALAGAKLLLNPKYRQKAADLAKKANHISLGGDPAFNAFYIEQMTFEQE